MSVDDSLTLTKAKTVRSKKKRSRSRSCSDKSDSKINQAKNLKPPIIQGSSDNKIVVSATQLNKK